MGMGMRVTWTDVMNGMIWMQNGCVGGRRRPRDCAVLSCLHDQSNQAIAMVMASSVVSYHDHGMRLAS